MDERQERIHTWSGQYRDSLRSRSGPAKLLQPKPDPLAECTTLTLAVNWRALVPQESNYCPRTETRGSNSNAPESHRRSPDGQSAVDWRGNKTEVDKRKRSALAEHWLEPQSTEKMLMRSLPSETFTQKEPSSELLYSLWSDSERRSSAISPQCRQAPRHFHLATSGRNSPCHSSLRAINVWVCNPKVALPFSPSR